MADKKLATRLNHPVAAAQCTCPRAPGRHCRLWRIRSSLEPGVHACVYCLFVPRVLISGAHTQGLVQSTAAEVHTEIMHKLLKISAARMGLG